MKNQLCILSTLLLITATAHADALDDIKQKGTLLVGVSYESPPFGQLDPKKQTVSGYDIDFADGIARKLGVKLVVKPIPLADRLTVLQNRQVDMVAATFTKNVERERVVDFSFGYFITGQKFVVKKGLVSNINQLANANIALVKGTTSETQLRKELPKAQVVAVSTEPEMFKLLSEGKVDAVTNDEPNLAVMLARMPNKAQFEIPQLAISFEAYGMAVRKGEKRLLKAINDGLVEMEQSGEATKIFDRWFNTLPIYRNFKIHP
ncbi:polar amino acid transport system substrate-binding protein [Chitinivorax tropicus]|uniref:Polar amino acid transport system substrate-binding protein n=1 Tax=Chitinivorax tropicus TaxID=714531 RepID=A0A840MRY3_9PROT|nr:transporter substrate-binding domain-containing protein [Chitinivorax tropicus]MBB5019186.1 polar amino acid transport system substrate-binding protein [Chitinivorax tropicus]